MRFTMADMPTGDLSEMEKPWEPRADVWIPAIRRAVEKLGGEEADVLIVWEKIHGDMTVKELEKLIERTVLC